MWKRTYDSEGRETITCTCGSIMCDNEYNNETDTYTCEVCGSESDDYGNIPQTE